MQKFYSTINQAVRLTEQDYGDRENWAQQGNQNEIEFINKYYVPYLNVIKTKKIAWNKPYVLYFEYGSALDIAVGDVIGYFSREILKNA